MTEGKKELCSRALEDKQWIMKQTEHETTTTRAHNGKQEVTYQCTRR